MKMPACFAGLSGVGSLIAIVIVVLCVLVLLDVMAASPFVMVLMVLGLAIARLT